MGIHDQRFKALQQGFLPEQAAGLDSDGLEWLQHVALTDPPPGDVYLLVAVDAPSHAALGLEG